jgi:hypothetical protein
VAHGNLDRIARIHADFGATRRLAMLLDGRNVAVVGATDEEWAALEPHLDDCGAEVKRILGPDVAVVITGSQATQDELVAAAKLDIAVLRSTDVTLIVQARRRVVAEDARLYDEALERVRDQGRLIAATRERRSRAADEPVTPERGMHVR